MGGGRGGREGGKRGKGEGRGRGGEAKGGRERESVLYEPYHFSIRSAASGSTYPYFWRYPNFHRIQLRIVEESPRTKTSSIRPAILTEHRLVTDRHRRAKTDIERETQDHTASTALAASTASCGKKNHLVKTLTGRVCSRDDNGNGIPDGNRNPTEIPCEWEKDEICRFTAVSSL